MSGDAFTLQAGGTGMRSEVSIRFIWKAWQIEGGSLRWELRRVFPSIGWEETVQTQLHKRVQQNLPAWRELWRALGMEESQHFGRSSHSLQQQARRQGAEIEAEAGAEREFWCSTAGVLSILLHGSVSRRSAADKMLVSDVFQLLLEHTVRRESLATFFEMQATAAMIASCSQPQIEGVCLCLHAFRSELTGVVSTREACWHMLKIARRMDCPAIMQWGGSQLMELATLIDDGVSEWHGQDVLHLAHLQSFRGNRRRADAHVRARAWRAAAAIREAQLQRLQLWALWHQVTSPKYSMSVWEQRCIAWSPRECLQVVLCLVGTVLA